jgi:ribosomal protein S18 acetylase RimI-like enzyme
LANIVFPYTYRDILTPEQIEYMMDWMYSAASLKKQIDSGHIYFIAKSERGESMGYMSINRESEDAWHLQKLYILPLYQGKHIGTMFIAEAERYILAHNSTPVSLSLNVNRHNQAQHFYRKLGFEITFEGDFHIGNGYYMNDYIMTRILS